MTTTTVNDTDMALRSLHADWNYARWCKLRPYNGVRYEVIDGVLYRTTAPSSFHGWIIRKFDRLVGMPAEDLGLALCFAAPVGVIMEGCDPVQPDFVIVRAHRRDLFEDRRINGPPDLIVEVLSPTNPENDEVLKLDAYARAAVPEYVIIAPATRTLRHYRLAQLGAYGEPIIYGEEDTASFDCLPGISLVVGALFTGAPDTTL